jgi:hypothetical protein
MNPKFLIAAAAATAAGLTAGATQATGAHNAGAYAPPSQPIAYSNLDAYLKAAPKARATRDWSAAAATGASVNSAATVTANAPATADTPTAVNPAVPATQAQPPMNQTTDTQPAAPAAPAAAGPPAQTPVTAPPAAQ